MDVEAAFPAHGDPAELVQQRKALFNDVAQLAQAFDAVRLGLGDDRLGAALVAGQTKRRAAVGLVPSNAVKRRRGRPRRPAIGG